MLTAYAEITYERPGGTEIASLVHRGEHMAQAERQLLGFVGDLIAAAGLPSRAAVGRLVAVTMAGLRPPR